MARDALALLVHHHEHGLLQAARLREAAGASATDRRAAAAAFLRFYEGAAVERFRDEEEALFPLLVEAGATPPPALSQALVDHVRVHALAAILREELDGGDVRPPTLARLGAVLHAHIQLERESLLPLLAGQPAGGAPRPAEVQVVPLAPPAAPARGLALEDVNATPVTLAAGRRLPEHVNDEVEVLLVVLAGAGIVEVDGAAHPIAAEQLVVLPRGARRAVRAGTEGLRYLSLHRRRGPLLPGSPPA